MEPLQHQPMEARPGAPAFADVLRALPQVGSEALVSRLLDSYGAARLACSALRDLVDQFVDDLRLYIRPGDLAIWTDAARPALLSQWPRVSSVALQFDAAFDAESETQLLLAVPVLESARERLTQLALSTDAVGWTHGEIAVLALAPRLPSLTSLDLIGLGPAMSYNPVAQHAMYCVLAASLPRLETLALPGCRSLDCLAPLAGSSSLRALTTTDPSFLRRAAFRPQPLSKLALAAVAQLKHLRHLHLGCRIFLRGVAGVVPAGLAELLASLPPSLERLGVGAVDNPDGWSKGRSGPGLAAVLRRGSVQSLTISSRADVCDASALAGVLLGWPPVADAQQLQQLTIMQLYVRSDEEAARPVLEPLLKLLGKCATAEMRQLHLSGSVSVAAAQQLLGRLPQQPKWLVLCHSTANDVTEDLRLVLRSLPSQSRLNKGGPDAAEAAAEGTAAEQHYLQAPLGAGGDAPATVSVPAPAPVASRLGPNPEDLLRTALQRWAAVGARCEPAADDGNPVPRAKVQLQGPAVALLVGTPQALTAWVRWLAEKAGVAVGAGSSDSPDARVVSYRVLPPVPAVLLTCSSEAAAAAVLAAAGEVEAAAVAAVASVQALAGVEPLTTGAGVMLEAVVVYGQPSGASQKVAREVLEGQHGAAAWSAEKRLRCVLQLWVLLRELPEAVQL